MNEKIVVIVGPTAIGKTSLGIALAKEFNGEIISADSRQVYKYMDIGTGKDLTEYQKENVIVWGIDLVDPNYHFNVSDWVKYARNFILDIQRRGKLPIIVGGTGLYIKSLLKPPDTLNIPINIKLRHLLNDCSVGELSEKLQQLDPNKFDQMNESDRKNPRRLVRAIEVSMFKESKRDEKFKSGADKDLEDSVILIGLEAEKEIIYSRISRRVDERLDGGMQDEVKKLVSRGYTFDLPSMSGIGYSEFKDSERNSPEQIRNLWKLRECQYAKRQMLFLKKYFPNIRWFDVSNGDYVSEVKKLVALGNW